MEAQVIREVYAEFFRPPADWSPRAIRAGESSVVRWADWATREHLTEDRLRSLLTRFADDGATQPTLYQVRRAHGGHGGSTSHAAGCEWCGGVGYVYVLVDFAACHTGEIVASTYKPRANSRIGHAVTPCICPVGEKHRRPTERALSDRELGLAYHLSQGNECERDALALRALAAGAGPDPEPTQVAAMTITQEQAEWLTGRAEK